MLSDLWPLYRLVLRTPRLELRFPGEDHLGELARLAADGVHDPAVQPFAAAWTDAPPAEVARSVLQWNWRLRADWSPGRWELGLVAIADGRVVGTQGIGADDFAVLREVGTGSWLGRAHHGRGYGTEMRAAVLELAFAGLGAEFATSEAFADNHASYAVSRKLGYADDGIARHAIRDRVTTGRRLRLDRASWEAARSIPVHMEGLDLCREMFLGPG
ncbi:GNAT family N-acetyltransferase [Paractinoplanes atraurantiacus]|uniref:Protein N-acetyltransferase, RimJ/RimL family n=1 Tax=Paractinoplanes atraurantiacus TaxID=1036182 RepID=A0A285JGI8_9ACTN|nr:GNAT family N-acetyltransferase [Actinoplanes atraurantiacus]SNY58261.1 Protein N-acetyltransferase, RimJ/RimL family [Actinoplanes atraurantiacus]